MKLFKSLLVAPATLGLLAPLSASANELNLNDVSGYSSSEEIQSIEDFNSELAVTNSRVDGLEVRMNEYEAGSFSDTTTASFGVDMAIGAVDGAGDSTEAVRFAYSMGIGLETSFTGEDSLSATIDVGNTAGATDLVAGPSGLNFNDTTDRLVLDGLTYSFPVGGATVLVGDNTDASATFTGACAYGAFTDFMGNCGTGYSAPGAKGVTAAMSYAFDGGVSFAAGISSTETAILTKEGDDAFAVEVAYSDDAYGLAVAYANVEDATYGDYTAWGLNGYYAFDSFTVSAGVESKDPDATATEEGYFLGLSFPEVGPGSFDIGMGTSATYPDTATEYYTYEASYTYPVNDGVTITPGVFIREGSTDSTGFVVKTSFSF